MRAYILGLILLLVSCNGGGGIVVIDPVGTWSVSWTFTPPPAAPAIPMPVIFEMVVSGATGAYEVMLPDRRASPVNPDMGPLDLTISGSSFTITGTDYALPDQEIVFSATGTISNTSLSGTWTETFTQLGNDPEVSTGPITGSKNP
jgi:hypothetical protein